MTQDRELRQEDLDVPEYAASRGARLEGILGRVSDAPLRDGNSIQLLKNGPDTYDDWLAAIGRAEVDPPGQLHHRQRRDRQRFAEALSAKAKEGVRVRVLHDWFGCMNVPRSFWRGMREAGVEVKAVNPPASGQPLGLFGATTASCSPSTASTPPRAACASPTAGWSAPPRRGCPTGTPPSA